MNRDVMRLLRSIGRLSPRAGRAPFSCELLETRSLMSTFAYSDLADLVAAPGARGLADGYYGPVVAVGDIDGDGTTDLLAGNGYWSATVPGSTVTFEGAALLSGATGSVIRTHEPGDLRLFGWSVAALGDLNNDGVPDYGVGTGGVAVGGTTGAPIAYAFSGATGEAIYSFGTGVVGPETSGYVIAGAGDVNGDGRPDILVSMIADNKTVLYSGLDGSALREFGDEGAYGLAGGKDLDGDEVPDLVMGTLAHLSVYSGATGTRLWRIDQPQAHSIPSVSIDNSTDFNGDDRVDLLVTTNDYFVVGGFGNAGTRARLYSGADGSELVFIPGPDDRWLASAAGAIRDLNGDGVPEIAASVRGTEPSGYGAGEGNGVYVYSGADGGLVSMLTDSGPATLTPPGAAYHGTPVRMAILGGVTTADLDGDGFSEIITSAVRDSHGSSQEAVTLRLISFDGATLGTPVFEHVDSLSDSSVAAWGRLGATDFVISQGRTVFLTDLGFTVNDRIVHFSAFAGQVLLVVAPGGDQTNPLAWYAAQDFTGPRTYVIKDATRITGPAGVYTIERVVDADGGQVLVQMMRDGATPTAFVFERTPAGSPSDPGRLAFRFDGRPIAIFAERVVGLSNDDPGAGVLWDFAQQVLIPGLRPVGLYLEDDGTSLPPVIAVGVAQRDGDAFGKVYRYNSETGVFSVAPLIEGGTEWSPVEVSAAGGIAGTFRRGSGQTSIFITRLFPGGEPAERTEDVLAADLVGAPDGLAEVTPRVIGVGPPAQGSLFEVYFSYDDAAAGMGRVAVLSDIAGPGPFRSPSGAAFSLSQDGTVLATRNIAGDVVFYQQSDTAGEAWRVIDITSSLRTQYGEPIYDTPHFGPMITWTQPGWTNPFIALGTEDGLILLEPIVNGTGGSGGHPTQSYIERYEARNLTTLTAGAAPITQGLTTLLPRTSLRIIAGLTAEGDLAMYGMTGQMVYVPGTVSAWTYANLFDQVLRPTGLPEPRFDVQTHGDLVSYVTSWGGLNIAGVDADTGDVVVFWHAPGLSGWRYSNLDSSLADPAAATGVSHLSVYLTSWGGINIVGGDNLGVYWWAPGLGGTWRFDRLTDVVADGPALVADTLTSYVTPWGGLNVAGLDQAGTLWVYWWTPTTAWTAETIDDALNDRDASVERAGRLQSTVTNEGRISIFTRSPFGDPLRYSWAPGLAWSLTDLNSIATTYS